ncbi:MAG: paraquat-inducible protein A [Idiomarina sp.]|nr:paraquat-inducible protein A [Idiomarina sp.]
MSKRRWRACPECDWVSALPALKSGEAAHCPRCDRELSHRHDAPAQRVLANSIAALLMLLLTLPFSFLSFTLAGMHQDIVLLDAAQAMFSNDWPILALLIALTIVVLPGLYLLTVIYLYVGIVLRVHLPGEVSLARGLTSIKPWLMTDVFLVGVLVSLAKLIGMAQIGFGWSFVAFCFYVLLLVRTVRLVDTDWLWFALCKEPAPPAHAQTGATAAEQQLVGCPCCGLLQADTEAYCIRCHTKLELPTQLRLQATWALLVASVILYIPANIYPMMTTVTVGGAIESTILGGVLQMVDLGSYLVAGIIFFASFVVPVAKILVLGYLCRLAAKPQLLATPQRMRWYRVTEFIGRWSMIDVFVVAIMVALIQAGVILSIYPGAAAAAFASVVILTMIAAMVFDPRLLWQGHTGEPDIELEHADVESTEAPSEQGAEIRL